MAECREETRLASLTVGVPPGRLQLGGNVVSAVSGCFGLVGIPKGNFRVTKSWMGMAGSGGLLWRRSFPDRESIAGRHRRNMDANIGNR